MARLPLTTLLKDYRQERYFNCYLSSYYLFFACVKCPKMLKINWIVKLLGIGLSIVREFKVALFWDF